MVSIDKLKTYCERKLGAPIIPIKLDREWVEFMVKCAEEDISDFNVNLSNGVKHLFIKRYVLYQSKTMIARIKGRYIKGSENELLRDVNIDPEELLKEGEKQLSELFIELDKIKNDE